MTATVLATFSKGVFRPDSPVDLPEDVKVELTISVAASPRIGSVEAVEAFIRHCRESPLHTGVGWNGRDELYDRF